MRIINKRPMLNAYPDSMGGTLGDIAALLGSAELKDVFSSFYILPSVFNTDLDRGFSVIDYQLNELLAKEADLDALRSMGIDLKLDFILNHASVLSPQFRDLLENGNDSEYKDFFINWNEFWEGCGTMTEEGYIRPDEELIRDMFFRKPGLPILMVRFPDGTDVPYWNTFYQEVKYRPVSETELMKKLDMQYQSACRLTECINHQIEKNIPPTEMELGQFGGFKEKVVELLQAGREYMGQMDLNIRSPLVWKFYDETLHTLAGYGAAIVRLDAFAYAPKTAGAKNFLNEPGTWELLEQVKQLAEPYGLNLLPEIHAAYSEGIYRTLSEKGYMTYDFFLPGLLLDAIERKRSGYLKQWALELYHEKIQTVNMLGCHDGIPLLDLKGILEKEDIDYLIRILVERGGYIKNLHGQENVYYQINTTYFSALGEDEDKLLLARAIQLFMPGKPQVWYLDLFAGTNDYEAVKKAGAGGHKEINRTNLTSCEIKQALQKDVVRRQLELIRFRNTCPAFEEGAFMKIEADRNLLKIVWTKENTSAVLDADLDNCRFHISVGENDSL